MAWGKMGALAAGIVVVAVAAHFLLNMDRSRSRRGSGAPATTATAHNAESAKPGEMAKKPPEESIDAADREKLQGRWIRTDADQYQIEIKEARTDGTLNASYHNPGPIRVSQANASSEEGSLKVFLELRDVGYPGCTYDLQYDTEQDRLTGVYFQAAQQQQYQVEFVRQSP